MKKTTVYKFGAVFACALGLGALVLSTREQAGIAQDRPPEAVEEASALNMSGGEPKDGGGDASGSLDGAAPAQPVPLVEVHGPPESVTALLDDFFAAITEARIDEAYAKLLKGSRIGSRPEDVRMLQDHARRAIAEYGAIQRFELAEIRPAVNSLLRLTYLSIGRDYPLRWRFYFYRGQDDWRLLDLRVDDRLTTMFYPDAEEAFAEAAEAEPSANNTSTFEPPTGSPSGE